MTHSSVWPVVSSQVVNGPPHSKVHTRTHTGGDSDKSTQRMYACTRMETHTSHHDTVRFKHTQDENMLLQEHAKSHVHAHVHAHTHTKQLFPTCWGGLETTSSQRLKHILFIYCSLKQPGRALSLHTHVLCVEVCVCVIEQVKKIYSSMFGWKFSVFSRDRLNLCSCEFEETLDVIVCLNEQVHESQSW